MKTEIRYRLTEDLEFEQSVDGEDWVDCSLEDVYHDIDFQEDDIKLVTDKFKIVDHDTDGGDPYFVIKVCNEDEEPRYYMYIGESDSWSGTTFENANLHQVQLSHYISKPVWRPTSNE